MPFRRQFSFPEPFVILPIQGVLVVAYQTVSFPDDFETPLAFLAGSGRLSIFLDNVSIRPEAKEKTLQLAVDRLGLLKRHYSRHSCILLCAQNSAMGFTH